MVKKQHKLRWLWPSLGLAMILSGCNAVFYYPSSHVYSIPPQYNFSYEAVEFPSTDGTPLSGWFIPALETNRVKGTILQFHGNAENMTSHYRSVIWLARHGYHVFTFDYRGFGQSGGTTQLYGAVYDSIAAIDYVRENFKEAGTSLILMGQSIGGALAVAAAQQSKEGVDAVVLEGAFSSYQRIAQDKLGDFPLTWPLQWPLSVIFVRDTYSPQALIGQLAPVPVLIIHGTADRVVPYYHGEILYEAAQAPKFFWKVAQGGHIQTFSRYGMEYRQKLLNFLEEWAHPDKEF